MGWIILQLKLAFFIIISLNMNLLHLNFTWSQEFSSFWYNFTVRFAFSHFKRGVPPPYIHCICLHFHTATFGTVQYTVYAVLVVVEEAFSILTFKEAINFTLHVPCVRPSPNYVRGGLVSKLLWVNLRFAYSNLKFKKKKITTSCLILFWRMFYPSCHELQVIFNVSQPSSSHQ